MAHKRLAQLALLELDLLLGTTGCWLADDLQQGDDESPFMGKGF